MLHACQHARRLPPCHLICLLLSTPKYVMRQRCLQSHLGVELLQGQHWARYASQHLLFCCQHDLPQAVGWYPSTCGGVSIASRPLLATCRPTEAVLLGWGLECLHQKCGFREAVRERPRTCCATDELQCCSCHLSAEFCSCTGSTITPFLFGFDLQYMPA
jgi:hypothetical protein